MQSKRIS